jgi:hypothetical protein
MNQKKYSLYSRETGLLTGVVISVPGNLLAQNIPSGCAAMVGELDHMSQRIDLSTGEVIDYQPAQPSPDHEWIHDNEQGKRVRRWQLTAAAGARNNASDQARGEIARLEAQQLRSVRELLLNPNDIEAIQRLDGIDTQIAELRSKLKR